MTIEEFYKNLQQDLLARVGAEKNFVRSLFTEHMCSLLVDQALIEDFTQTDYKFTTKGMAVDAWTLDRQFKRLHLFISDYRETEEPDSLSAKNITDGFQRLSRFFEASRKESFVAQLEDANPITELGWTICRNSTEIESISLTVFSNAVLSSRAAEFETTDIAGTSTTFDVWDLQRLHRLAESTSGKEAIEVNLLENGGSGIPCLQAYTDQSGVRCYLLAIPGRVLADMYARFGERLLEQNVRTFLQFRGKVNKGIRLTILNEPGMFFSYNNGISATADDISIAKDGMTLVALKNLQIVNGGQTTAAIFNARRDKPECVDKIYVQMKLSVIPAEKVEEVVPRISEFANTQNKVSASDFFANHPFHLRMQDISRRLWAPPVSGSAQQTHWFYERARGQFANAQNQLSATDRRKFLLQNPPQQMITKTDLAKYILSFESKPHVVSLGAQKAFAGSAREPGFVSFITVGWDANNESFGELWFKHAVAKTILFRELDRAVLKAKWYTAYKANIVTYTLARFQLAVESGGHVINFTEIWQQQVTPKPIAQDLVQLAELVSVELLNPPEGTTSNISEWAKQPACWNAIKELTWKPSAVTSRILLDLNAAKSEVRQGRRDQVDVNSLESVIYITQRGAAYWQNLADWNETRRILSPLEIQSLSIACRSKVVTDRQATMLIAAERRAKLEGFQ